MSNPVFAKVAVENTAYSFDKLFDYLIPDFMAESLKVGCRVLVDFGRSSKKRQGIVFEISRDGETNGKKLKYLEKQLDREPLLDDEMLSLAKWISGMTFCTLFDSAKALLPTGICLNVTETYRLSPEYSFDEDPDLPEDEKQTAKYLFAKDTFVPEEKIKKDLGFSEESDIIKRMFGKGILLKNTDTLRKINDATIKIVYLSPEYKEEGSIPEKLTAKQSAVVKLLRDIGSAASKEISYYTGVTQVVVEKLHSKGIVYYEDAEVFRTPKQLRETKRECSPIVLTETQNRAYEELKEMLNSGKAGGALLFGVTGSGKTKIYMRLIDDLEKENKGVIVLVPEISLTPQLLTAFYARYGDKVAVLHSGLSLGERADEWKRIKNGSASIVVGTRSASFAPVKNLAAVIMDEEQEGTYKSEMSPRYHARDIARFRCAYNKGLLIMGSATPSVETFAGALNGRYRLIELTERYSKSGLPKVIVTDVSQRENMEGMQTISTVLRKEMAYNLEKGQQTILLINRRGFNTFIACTKCKNVIMCPNCSISMTYHSVNDRLMCHYCGYSEPAKTVCPVCGEETVRFSGFGTQKVEQEVQSLFPEANILRMDADTTSAKNSHEKKFNEFSQGKYDIMIGTQMVAKGLDFPNVTLVGVISVDQQLYNDDYKSSERTFDLLTQVVGRSGRGEKTGRAVIQTLAPENAVIELAAMQDYRGFYNSEIAIRKGMIYPPYCDICEICFSGASEITVKNASVEFFRRFRDKIKNKYQNEKVVVLGPIAPKVAKISSSYRERIIIKCRNSKNFRKLTAECLKEFSTIKGYNNVAVYCDMNPESLY